MRISDSIFKERLRILAIAISSAILMPAFYSCNTDKDEPKAPPTNTPAEPQPGEDNDPQPDDPDPSHFEGLETVMLPEGLASQIKEYTGFTLSYNKDNKTPNYVAWELLGTEVSNNVSRTNNFWKDTEIVGCTAHSDYTGSGYDRGHMC
ncbi:MAG: DNA/RNA non-specific endonuclease, partial [Muribaculaceae bacterium]|nr:DNA/RNA non-specific endonuclease [Muribaculaceae bacterium]